MEQLTNSQGNLCFIKILQENYINPTSQRLQICRLLLSRRQHITVEGIMNFFEKNQRPISRATVYNTLNLFSEKSLIQPVQLDAEKVFYDSYTKPHHHFYNVDTEELIDIEQENLEVIQKIALPSGMELLDTQIIIRVQNQKKQIVAGLVK